MTKTEDCYRCDKIYIVNGDFYHNVAKEENLYKRGDCVMFADRLLMVEILEQQDRIKKREKLNAIYEVDNNIKNVISKFMI